MSKKLLPWRVKSGERGDFDELVVGSGKGLLIHAEMMDHRSCFVDVAGLLIWVHVDKEGVARISHVENDRARFIKGAMRGPKPFGKRPTSVPPGSK